MSKKNTKDIVCKNMVIQTLEQHFFHYIQNLRELCMENLKYGFDLCLLYINFGQKGASQRYR